MSELIIYSGKHRGKKLVLPDGEIVIGRDENCGIRLTSEDVSRRHCCLRSSADGISVRDLGSRNGTFINDVSIVDETLLEPGDVLRVGPMSFQLSRKHVKTQQASDEPQQASPHPPVAAVIDDAIASWLSGDDDGEGVSSGETAILSRESAEQMQQDATPLTPAPIKKEFHSIAEEATDIIRRHKEMEADEDTS